MGINLNNHGLGGLAGYRFEETNSLTKGHNLATNKHLIAVRSKTDKATGQVVQEEITILDKKLITCWNRFKSLFGKGPLANLDYDFFTVGKFVEKKLKEIKSGSKEKDFSKLSFEGEGKEAILENIYAIANRMKFVHQNWDSALFNLVSKEGASNPKVLTGVTSHKLENRVKHNPGMNARFLTIYLKSLLEAEKPVTAHFKAIKMSDVARKEHQKQSPLGTAQTTADFVKGRDISLIEKIKYDDITYVIVQF